MKCELCEAQKKHGKKIMFMGAPVIVCDECAVNGRIIGDVREQIVEKKKQDNTDKEISPATVLGEPEYEIVENFSHKIKDIREKKNLKQEDFAKRINEPVAYVKRIESGFVPSITVIQKIEQFLNINLIKKRERVVLPKIDKSKDVLTLGDVVVIKKK
ncbi:MAG: multiprotein-bridging factor 1 family protein [Candidatus Altarchaeum sp.]|nr:multiprotein-bridging factor 1 family protein [Candidatus Altarchaeum sp.]